MGCVFEIVLIIIFIPFGVALLGLVYYFLCLRVLSLSHKELDREDQRNRMMIRGAMTFSSDLPDHLRGKYDKKLRGMHLCLKVLAGCALALVVYMVIGQLI